MKSVLVGVAAYLLGTFPTAILVAKSKGVDITKVGSGNPGASNVFRALGRKYGVLVIVADIGKGFAASGLGYQVVGRSGAWVCGLAAICGHMFPITRKFKGGKGVATGAGALALLFPMPVVILGVVWLLTVKVSRKASLGSLTVSILFPGLSYLFGYELWETGALVAIALIVVVRHARNIGRLLRGEEFDLIRKQDGN